MPLLDNTLTDCPVLIPEIELSSVIILEELLILEIIFSSLYDGSRNADLSPDPSR